MVGKEVIGDFEVEVFEDTYITAVHCKYGHKYSPDGRQKFRI